MARKEKPQNLAHATTLLVDSTPGDPVRGNTVTLDALTPPVSATPWHERLSSEEAGRYVEQTVLGAGGFGEVLAVYDTHLERSVALKQLHLREPSLMSALELRFVNEARITGKLEQPGIVPVYELGQRAADDAVYDVMRLVRGQSLQEALEGADLRARLRLLPHFVDACHAVAYAHSRGVVHRDLKPDNIMIGPFGQTLVVDWGSPSCAARTISEARPSPTVWPACKGARPRSPSPARRWAPRRTCRPNSASAISLPSTSARTSTRSAPCPITWSRASRPTSDPTRDRSSMPR